jgi:hypothetical protein
LAGEFRNRNKIDPEQQFACSSYGSFLTFISIVNCSQSTAFHGVPSGKGDSEMATTRSGGSKRGFAAMDPAKQREIASKGGKASHGGGRKSSSSR